MIVENPIIGDLVTLRSVHIDDAEYTFKIRQDKEKTKYLHVVEGTIDSQKKWIEEQQTRLGDYFFLVTDNHDNPIGTYSVYNIKSDKSRAETGRAILYGNPAQNLETILLFFDFCFIKQDISNLYSYTAKDNTKANGVAKRLGGSVIKCEYDNELQLEMETFLICKEAYLKNREKLVKLVNHFTNHVMEESI